MLRCHGQCNLVFKYFSQKRKKGLERKQNKYSDYVAERKVKGVDQSKWALHFPSGKVLINNRLQIEL